MEPFGLVGKGVNVEAILRSESSIAPPEGTIPIEGMQEDIVMRDEADNAQDRT